MSWSHCGQGWRRSPSGRRSAVRRCSAMCASRPLLAALHGNGGVRYLHRPANPEDVFLKLTGREMRD